MNWELFLLYIFIFHVAGLFFTVVLGVFEAEKEKKYSPFMAVLASIALIILICMWFWT